MLPEIFELPSIGSDEIGYLSVFEELTILPFKVKRIYWTYNTPKSVIRGGHSHISLHQFLVSVQGSITVVLEGKGEYYKSFHLNKPNIGLYVPPGYWRTLKFINKSVLLSIASDFYEKEDYIRDYDVFKNTLR